MPDTSDTRGDPGTSDDSGAPDPTATAGSLPTVLRRTLILAPLVVLGLMLVFRPQLRWASAYAMVTYWTDRASARMAQDDLAGAEKSVERAFRWLPNAPDMTAQLHYLRARIRQEAGNLRESLEDYDRVVEAAPGFAAAYSGRADVLRRTGRPADALHDLDRAIRLRPADDPRPLNHRAYCRALAGIELEEGLEDIEEAIRLAGSPRSALLDTRGYVFFRLDRLNEARDDLQRAVSLAEEERQAVLESQAVSRQKAARRKRLERQLDENLAVIYRHRGEVQRALGNNQAAEADLNLAAQLGYDPLRGVE